MTKRAFVAGDKDVFLGADLVEKLTVNPLKNVLK